MSGLILILTTLMPLLDNLFPALVTIIEDAITASNANDQATLDALHLKAIALAESLKPTDA